MAFAGIMTASRLGSAEPSTGTGLEMKVICGSIIGGISIAGGMGTMAGAALGAVFMEALTNSLTVMRISVYGRMWYLVWSWYCPCCWTCISAA